MAKKYTKRDSFWKRIRFKYKLSFLNENTLEEVFSLRLSQLSVFMVIALVIIMVIVITSTIIITTPIRNYLPGYLDVEVRKEIVSNALRADSLSQALDQQSLYLNNVAAILRGDIEIDSIQDIKDVTLVQSDFNIPEGEKEGEFVKKFEEEEKYNLSVMQPAKVPVEGVFFYKPVNGIVSSKFDAAIKHYGIDIAASPKESVLATLDGTVVYTGFDANAGNIIQVQHKNGFISIYKHNDKLLKKMGDHVVAGEAIALAGNTGELTTGPHLHFELWYKGAPVDPEEYIAF